MTVSIPSPGALVLRGGPAEAAGLPDGLPLLGWSFRYGDTLQPVAFVVQADGERRRIEHLPIGREPVVVPRCEWDPRCGG